MINKKPKITINLPSEGDSFLEELENSSLQKDSVILSVQELNDPQALTKRASKKNHPNRPNLSQNHPKNKPSISTP